jgi:hypothetical protein
MHHSYYTQEVLTRYDTYNAFREEGTGWKHLKVKRDRETPEIKGNRKAVEIVP